jgi:N6-adenosine-specific RNA methylase IME4
MNLPEGPFGCILADPPWTFNAFDGRHAKEATAKKWGLAAVHYGTEDMANLLEIPVASVAAKDCALFMWVVDALMPQALELGAAWGFTFKTSAFLWMKSREGYSPVPALGYWTRKQTEQCWLFTRGSPKRLSKGVEQVIHCPRGAHSAKPDRQYERIEALVGGPYLELFARSARPGWTAWGNEVGIRDGDLFRGAAG